MSNCSSSKKLNTIEKIQYLKSFVGGPNGDFEESELTECLRMCGYNLERAAQKLLTGEFRELRHKKKAYMRLNSHDDDGVGGVVRGVVHLAKNGRTDTTTATAAATSTAVTSSYFPAKKTNAPAPKRKANEFAKKPPPPSLSIPRNSSSSSRLQTPMIVTPNNLTVGGGVLLDLTQDNMDMVGELDTKPAATAAPQAASMRNNKDMTSPLLLCKRWLADDVVVTSRGGKVDYQEVLTMDGLTRFRGRHMEGRLPRSIAKILSPLGDYIALSAESLMEDHQLKQGHGFPVQLTVTLVRPIAFFECMEMTMQSNAVKSQHFFHQGTSKKTTAGNKKDELSPAEAAFRLVQWAEYGDDIADYSKEREGEGDDDEEEEKGAMVDSAHGEDGQVEGESNATDDALGLTGVAVLGEAVDPPGLTEGISLRPYQRQALFFLDQRETIGSDRDQVEEQLGLLRELSEITKSAQTLPDSPRGQKVGAPVSCDCGPVRVLQPDATMTLDGDVNPVNHPLWKRRYLASPSLDKGYVFYVNELLGVALHRPPPPPTPCSGGILADAMGLGKTVMLMSLILKAKHERGTQRPTLVVAKLSLLPQWEEELATKTNLRHRIHYGSSMVSKTDIDDLDVVVTTYGTLQGELNSKAGSAVLLGCHWLRVILDEAHCIRNQRTLASRACCALKADHRWCVSGTIIQNSMDDLLGVMKFLQHEPWCWNSFWKAAISDPANETDPEKREESLRVALDRARRVLNPIMLRRNKDSLSADGTPILTLPPIETKVVKVELSESEREFYQAVLHQSQTVFAGFEKNGTASKSYFQIFSLLQRLRQTCDHISLTVKSRVDSTDADRDRNDTKKERGTVPASESSDEGLGTQFFENLLAKFAVQEGSGRKKRCPEDRNGNQEPELDSPSKRKAYASSVALSLSQAIEDNATHVKDECAICLETPKIEDAVLTPCAHVFCRECLLGVLHFKGDLKADAEGSCPTCQLSVEPMQLIAMKKHGNNMAAEFLTDTKPAAKTSKPTMETKESARDILLQSIGSVESAKMKAIFTELSLIWEADPRAKILIFSHYLGFLDLLRIQLQRQQVTHFRLDGSLRLKERSSVLAEFRCNPERSVLLMSMSAGGEGLNIVSASACFIVEPWWNSAKEDQCVNRIHRIGQLADTVLVRKFVVADTVEESMVELQKRKAYVADEVYSASGTVDREASARLSLDDFRLIFRGNQG